VDHARDISRVALMEVSSVNDTGKLLTQNEAPLIHIDTWGFTLANYCTAIVQQ